MLISSFVSHYYLPSRVGISEGYANNIRATVRRFSIACQKLDADLTDLTTENIGRFLTAYAKRWSASATNSQRQNLLMIWRAAYRQRKIDAPPPELDMIRKLPEERDPPEAWSESQVSDLMEVAADEPGMVCDIPAGDWWLSLFCSIYWTSTRISAMLAVPSACYDGDGILVRLQKNHRPQWHPLPETCREVIERTRPSDRKLIWHPPWHPRTVWKKARRIIESAGLPAPMTGRQLFHRLRRTTITLCAAVDPVVAQQTAGHKDYSTTLQSYIDPRMVRRRSAMDILPDPLAKRDPWPEKPFYETQTPRFRIYG